MRLVHRWVVGVVVAGAMVLLVAAPASAHAQLISTTPEANAILTAPPRQVTLQFGENVEVSLGAIRLFDANGNEISIGPPEHPGGTGAVVAADLPTLGTGAYVVAWRVVSADSHPVHGAFTFQIGAGSGVTDPNLVSRILTSEGGDRIVGVVLGAARFLAYAALAVLVGGLWMLAVAWPDGERSRRARAVLWAALVVGLLATAAGIGVQAPYAEGSSLSRMFEPAGWQAVVATRSGRAWEARLLLLAVAGAGLLFTLRWIRSSTWRLVALVAGGALVVAYAESGHGGVGRDAFVGLVSTIGHLTAMSIWVGGLVMLALVVLPTAVTADALAVTRRFSAYAFAAVAVIVVSGVVQAWRQVGSLDALTSTTYGRVLLVKTALVIGLIGVGAASRRLLQRRLLDWRPQTPARALSAAVNDDAINEVVADDVVDEPESARRRLRRTIGAEVVLAAAVLTVTSLLVATAPAIAQASGPFDATVVQGNRIANITVIPAHAGRNTLHIYVITPGGALQAASEISVSITNSDRDVGPLSVDVEIAGPNHVTTDAMQIPFAGTWQLDVDARFGDFDQTTFTTNFHAP